MVAARKDSGFVLRDVVVVPIRADVAFPVRDVDVAVRATVFETLRDEAVRADCVDDAFLGVDIDVPEREITPFDLVARVVPAAVLCTVFPRETVDASRTAAAATPMPKQHAKITDKTFLILYPIWMIAKKIIFEQGLIYKKCIKNPVV